VNSPNRLVLAVGFVAAMGTLGASKPATDGAMDRADTGLYVRSVMRVDSLQIADSVRGAATAAGGGWLVVQIEVESPSIDTELLGDVTLRGGRLARPLDVRGFSHEPNVRPRTLFYRVIEDRGGGFFTPSGHVHWITTRAGRVRLEVFGHAVFGVAFDAVQTEGPFELRFGSLSAEVRLPAMIGAR